jgi:ATP-dependent Clp protease adaptor protein ClpS|tara:strand:- start:4422 stop:4724 length:303 start_codon:yes stop_codon:yes gene_type:complete
MTQASTQGVADITKLKSPPRYNVVLLNDETTPQDFVVNVLQAIFNKSVDEAKLVMLEVHEKGRGIAGTYSYEVAEQKSVETITDARRNEYPLDVTIEKSE